MEGWVKEGGGMRKDHLCPYLSTLAVLVIYTTGRPDNENHYADARPNNRWHRKYDPDIQIFVRLSLKN